MVPRSQPVRRTAQANPVGKPSSVTLPAKPRAEPWRVGVLFSQCGNMAVIEQTQLKATLLAIGEINEAGGIGGEELVPVVYDPGSETAQFAAYAQRLLIEDEITTIFGCYTSSSRKAVLPVVERFNGL